MPEEGSAVGLFYERGGVMLGVEDGWGEVEDVVVGWRGGGH